MSDFRLERIRVLTQFLEDIRAGKRLMGISTGFNSPISVEIAAQMGFGWVIADMEHTLMSGTQKIDVIRAAEWARIPVFVKVNTGSSTEIRDAMDAGASGIQAPNSNTPDDVRSALADLKYVHQGGTRGRCPVARTTFYGGGAYEPTKEWFRRDDEMASKALLMPTIETGEAIDNIDALLKIEECPIWHIGAVDLASSLGLSESDEKDMTELMKAVIWITRKIQAAGKTACRVVFPSGANTIEETAESLELIDLPYALDTACMAQGMWHQLEANRIVSEKSLKSQT